MKSKRDIIFKPVVSEKSYMLNEDGKYSFFVEPKANKTEIKIAIEDIFNVKVSKVNTINKQGKVKKTRFGTTGKEKNTKKAIVTLKEGTIDIFGQSPVEQKPEAGGAK